MTSATAFSYTERITDRRGLAIGAPELRPVTMEYMTTAIVVVTLALVGIGIVIDELFRLRRWLNKAPPSGEDNPEPPDGSN